MKKRDKKLGALGPQSNALYGECAVLMRGQIDPGVSPNTILVKGSNHSRTEEDSQIEAGKPVVGVEK